MLHTTKLNLPPPSTTANHHHNHRLPPPRAATATPPPVLKQCCNNLTRRDLAIFTKSTLLLLLTSQPMHNASEAQAEEQTQISKCGEKLTTKQAFLDVSIDGDPVGRIVIGLYGDDTSLGASRFADLVTGRAGISYRKKQFVKIMPTYVQHGGVRSFGVDAELAKRTGAELVNDALVEEWRRVSEECKGVKNLAGSVGIIVRDPAKPGPKTKLVAREGRLEIDEEVGVEPNGTEFVIVTRDEPELDSKVLVVGRVVQGMDVVEKIGQVKTVQENTSSPYFRVAKLIGDKRAVVAERGFNRPYSKIVVTNCGLQE
ncbi:Peptidyl-prolyl cis-trans isomerase CYP26-2, chloroplastic-like protein [Drosera capensis]